MNTYKGKENYRTGLCQEIWTENKKHVGPSATRRGGRVGCWQQLWCNHVFQGKMLEAITQLAKYKHRHVHSFCWIRNIWVPCSKEHSCHLTLPRRVCRRQEDGHSAVNKGHRSCVSHTENPIFQRTSGSLLMGNCREIIFLLGMLLLSGNKGLIFQGCQCNIFL